MGTNREAQEFIRYLQSQRTTTEAQVRRSTVLHEAHDLTPAEVSALAAQGK